MGGLVNRQWLLKKRPLGLPGPDCYEWREVSIPKPRDGECVIRNAYVSLDPAIRGWMDDAPSYLPPIPLGTVVRASTVGRVIESRAPGFAVGDVVQGFNGWEDYSLADTTSFITKVPTQLGLPPTNFLSILGAAGLTAYFGLLDIGKPVAGETVLISGAAGAVGSLVGQIAKLKGCRVVGIAGGAAKCAWAKDKCGFDAVIDYKRLGPGEFESAIRATCPEGIDIYFDNVGGPLLDAALLNLRQHARVVLCGAISNYNAAEPVPGSRNLWQLLVKNARMEGFVVIKYRNRFAEAVAAIAQWIHAGEITFREHIDRGLENTPQSFLRLFTGDHEGKLIVDVCSDVLNLEGVR